MVNELNARGGRCCVVSIDVPSGTYSGWTGGQPVVHADITLAIEHLKTELYKPLLRLHCGKIIPVQGVFPAGLLEKHGDAWLLSWESCSCAIAPLDFGAYKYTRGLCEIHAGSTGTAGAALLSAAGASAAGAGLIKAVLDDDLYPVLGAQFSGVMAAPCSAHQSGGNNFVPHALLLGPGWGKGDGRLPALQQALMAEESGAPVILDADGIYLIKKLFPDLLSPGRKSPVFHGRVILTPHAGELESLSGIPKTELLSNPQLIAGIAKTLNAVILFKSHVMVVSAPDGRLGFIDGMNPALGAGGSGDFLAGLCAGIAARAYAAEKAGEGRFDPFLAAAAAGALLVAAAGAMGRRFFDPGELALPAARLAGQAWLP
jgi:NAD(P)H-hydrate epimerase